jgi:hypothetical protein
MENILKLKTNHQSKKISQLRNGQMNWTIGFQKKYKWQINPWTNPSHKGMWVKTTPVRTAILKETNNKFYGGREKDTLYTVTCKLVQPLGKSVWRFLRKLKIEPLIILPYHS